MQDPLKMARIVAEINRLELLKASGQGPNDGSIDFRIWELQMQLRYGLQDGRAGEGEG